MANAQNATSSNEIIVGARGDFADILTTVAATGFSSDMSSTERTWFGHGLGPRGETWEECFYWFKTMPGTLFQLTCVLLCLAFMGGGKSVVAATYNHVLCACAFLVLSIVAVMDLCSPDILVWALVLVVVNVAQIIYITHSSKLIDKVFTSQMQTIYHKRFAPFNIPPNMFVELVSCKGCQLLKLEKGQKYAAEGKTPIEKISIMLSGKMVVSCEGKFLHFVGGNDFIDSPEWESLKSSSSKSSYKVTITAETECHYISWKRKPLLNLLAKRRRLSKLISFMIGQDVMKKLYALNSRQFNVRGFHYDIRLPCIMSLRDDVLSREKKRQEATASQPGSPSVEESS